MPLVKYIATPSPDDRTEELRLVPKNGQACVAVLGGDAVEMDDSEFYSLIANGYGLEVVDTKTQDPEPKAEVPSAAPVSLPQSPGAASPQTTPTGV